MTNAPKVKSVEEDSDFEWYNKSDGKPVHVDIDKKITERIIPTVALLPNRSEEDKKNNNCETRGEDGNISVRRCNRRLKPPERLGSVPNF